MISLKKYLDGPKDPSAEPAATGLAVPLAAAYRSALAAMGNCAEDACPALGDSLKRGLEELGSAVSAEMTAKNLDATDKAVREQLQEWGQTTARHYQEKTSEVRELLLVMARTAESVGSRDERCAGQFNAVTTRLANIASLEDLTQIRTSIRKSAEELKTSIDRMNEEGRAVLDHLRGEVTRYQERLEQAQAVAFRDALTGQCSRLCAEHQLVRRIAEGNAFCVAIVDIDGLKQVNDKHGHVTGDDLLRQFAREMRSACRAEDLIGRWGGDEFLILLDSPLSAASAQVERMRKWVCGQYELRGKSGNIKLPVSASIGLAEWQPDEGMTDLLARADAAMYENKSATQAGRR